ncbi:hypothetical protein SDC9_191772 [bioreactor metagenome]|uniref:Uncharacterized protein n=1 Tax=bioreactor metagenome TaxID=1076179 RepID=A0A645HYT3_9ZZZZ
MHELDFGRMRRGSFPFDRAPVRHYFEIRNPQSLEPVRRIEIIPLGGRLVDRRQDVPVESSGRGIEHLKHPSDYFLRRRIFRVIDGLFQEFPRRFFNTGFNDELLEHRIGWSMAVDEAIAFFLSFPCVPQ